MDAVRVCTVTLARSVLCETALFPNARRARGVASTLCFQPRLTMEIRIATLEDARTLAALNHHVHDLHVEAEPDRYSATDDAAVADRFREFVGDPATEVLLVEGEGTPLGYVVVVGVDHPSQAFAPARRWALIDQIAVVPGARRTGVGRVLMDAAENSARRRGYAELQLDVRAHNEGARAFYESLGFEISQSRLNKPI